MNPNHLAALLGMTAPLALAYMVMGRFSPTTRVLLGYSAAVMLAGIVVTVSRGGIVTAVISLVVLCGVLLTQRDFWRPGLALLCILTVLGLAAASQFESIHKRFDQAFKHDKIGDQRPQYWAAAWQLFKRDPAWGVGPGHFDIEFPSVRPALLQNRPIYAHNDYINTLCDWGVAGMGVIAAACGLLGWGIFQVWQTLRRPALEKSSKYSERTAFVVGASIALMAVMLHCILEFNMQIAALAVTTVTLMALLAAQMRFATERYWRNPGRRGKILLTVLAAALIGYLSAQGVRKGSETYWLARANPQNNIVTASGFVDPMLSSWLAQAGAQGMTPEAVVACLIRAHEAEPMNWETDYILGEYLLQLSLQEGPDYLDQARQALGWYAKAMQLNRFDAYAPVGGGLCLDWMGHPREATPYFKAATRKDPHNGYIAQEAGRHCIELGQLETAKQWFLQAWKLSDTPADIAEYQHLEQFMADPLYGPGLLHTNKSPDLQAEMDPPLPEGSK
jgi:tetratricopeptide (TPR) repeat protein